MQKHTQKKKQEIKKKRSNEQAKQTMERPNEQAKMTYSIYILKSIMFLVVWLRYGRDDDDDNNNNNDRAISFQ